MIYGVNEIFGYARPPESGPSPPCGGPPASGCPPGVGMRRMVRFPRRLLGSFCTERRQQKVASTSDDPKKEGHAIESPSVVAAV